MPSLEISSYRVGTMYGKAGEYTRYLFLEPVASRRGPDVSGVRIFFGPSPDEIGHLAASILEVSLPDSLFTDMYHIVQTEKPVYFNWQFEGDGESVRSCGINTIEEPLGEGFRDLST